MTSRGCTFYNGCGAPLCPEDGNSVNGGIWYPEEEVCRRREFGRLVWVRKQRKVVRRHGRGDRYWTVRMLERIGAVHEGCEGLAPDRYDMRGEEERWLKRVKGKKVVSEEELKRRRESMMRLREVHNIQGNKDKDGLGVGEVGVGG